jgi:acetoin utilization deacetylase AcuC-like enzyme
VLPFRLVHSDDYDLHIGDHVFPAIKYRLVRDALIASRLAAPTDFITPQPAADEDVLLVHSADWVARLQRGDLTADELANLDIPYSAELVRAMWLCAGGSITAGRLALGDGVAVNLGGGFHHAFPEFGEAFCAINDVAIAIRRLQADHAIQTAMIVDLDVHHGNGTAVTFAGDDSVFTFSMHQDSAYPAEKPPSDLDVGLPDRCDDASYLALLRENLGSALARFRPDLVSYVAGADPYEDDEIGNLALTLDGLKERDRTVFAMARERALPIAVTLAGGYARSLEDTVAIHVGTVRAALEVRTL